ncbi:MAG: Formate dehydrogenase, mitochondrial [Desulfovibrio sp.]
MPVVFTPMPIFNKPGPVFDLLGARGFTFEWAFTGVARAGRPSPEETQKVLLQRAGEIEYYLANVTPLTREFFEKAVNLKHVAMFGVGLEHIDIPAATDNGVVVSNAPGGNSRCVAEMALCFMLDLAHRVSEMRADMRNGLWRPKLGGEISGKTLGIVGFGHIGQDLASLAKAFGMEIIVANRSPRPDLAAKHGVTQLPLEEVLAKADFISLHIPGGSSSWHFGAKEFAHMKKGAVFINTARGELMDMDALADALASGHLAGAGLDVFPEEPVDFTHRIFSLPQLALSPHAGGMSIEAMLRVVDMALAEFGRTAKGEKALNVRNPEVYDSPNFRGKQ